MEAEFLRVRDFGGSCEDPELTLVLLLRLSRLDRLGRLEGERPWFTPGMSAHWEATKNLDTLIRNTDKKKPYMLRVLGLLLDRGQLKEAIDLIINHHFILDAPTLKRIHQMNPYAPKLCLSALWIRFDKDSIGEITDWAIENFDHRDSRMFVGFLIQSKENVDSVAKVINHVPEVLKYFSRCELSTKSKLIVELAIFHGMADKLRPKCFKIDGLSDLAKSFEPKHPTDDIPADPAWLAYNDSDPKTDAELEGYSETFRADYRHYYDKLWDNDPLTNPNHIEELQKIYETDRRWLVTAALCDTYSPRIIPLETVKWFISRFDASNLFLFAHLFINCDVLEGSRLLLEHAPNLLLYVEDWSLTDANLTDLVIEYGAGHKLLPRPGRGEAYEQAVKMQEFLLTQEGDQYWEEHLELILASRFPLTPHKLAINLRNYPQFADYLRGYLQDQTAEYREEYQACVDLLYPTDE